MSAPTNIVGGVVKRYLAAQGRKGGRSTAERLTAQQKSRIGRRAAIARWEQYRRAHGVRSAT